MSAVLSIRDLFKAGYLSSLDLHLADLARRWLRLKQRQCKKQPAPLRRAHGHRNSQPDLQIVTQQRCARLPRRSGSRLHPTSSSGSGPDPACRDQPSVRLTRE